MKKIFLTLAVALLSIFSLSAQIDRSKAPAPGPAPKVEFGDFEKFTLDNGLRVILVEDHDRPVVSLGIRFLTEPEVEGAKAGLSSIFGDLWSKGTSTLTAEQISQKADFLGAEFSTSAGYIGFRTLTKYTDDLMQLLCDVLYNPTFPEDELSKLKDQILGVLKMSRTEPSSIMSNIQIATIYPSDHPYSDIATEETTVAVSTDDCRAYWKENIIPNNAIMIVTGDITAEQLRSLSQKYLAAWKPGVAAKSEFPAVRRPQGIEVVFSPKDGAVQSSIYMVNVIDIKPGAEDVLAFDLAASIYGGGDMSAKLFKNLRETKGYTYGAYSDFSTDVYTSTTFESYAEVNLNATDSSFIEMRREVENMLAGDYTEADLRKFKSIKAGNFSRSLENPSSIANYAFNMERYSLPHDYYATYLQRLDAVTMEDVAAAVKKYFDPRNAYYFVVGDPSVLPAMQALDSDSKVVELDFYGRPYVKKEIAADVTVQTVFDKYIEFLGGADLVAGVKDLTEVYEMDMMGMKIFTTLKRIPGQNAFSQTQSMNGQTVAYLKYAEGKLSTLAQDGSTQMIFDADQVREAAQSVYPIPEARGARGYELIGIETVDGRDLYKVRKTGSSAASSISFYDVETGEKVMTQESAEGMTATTYYRDYQPTKYGLIWPMTQVVDMGSPQMAPLELKCTKIKFNGKLKISKL